MDPDKVIEQMLAEAKVLDDNDAAFSVERVEKFVADLRVSLTEYITWVSEKAAIVRSGHKAPWFAQRFPEWKKQGHARYNPQRPRERQYRQLIVPIDGDIGAVQADARLAAQGGEREKAG